MRFVKVFLGVVVGISLGLFLLLNNGTVTLTYLPGKTTSLPLAVILLGAALVGAAPMTILWIGQIIMGSLRIKALRKDSRDMQDRHARLGVLEAQEKVSDPENLLKEVEAGLVRNPADGRLRNLKARLLVRLDREAEVMERELPRLLAADDPDPETSVLFADRLVGAGRIEDAEKLLKKLLSAYPDADIAGSRLLALAFRTGDVTLVTALMEKRGPFLSPTEKLAGELFLLESRDDLKPDDRIKGVERLVRRFPDVAGPRITQLRVLSGAGKLTELTVAARKSYEETGSLAVVTEAVARLLTWEDPQDAIGFLRDLILAHPERISLQLVLAQLYLSLEMPQQAAETVDGIGGVVGDTGIGQFIAGKVALRRREFEKAASYFRQALDHLGQDAVYRCGVCSAPNGSWELRCHACGRFLTLEAALGIALKGEEDRYGFRHPEITFP